MTASVLKEEATSKVPSDASVFVNGGTLTECECVQTADSQINSSSILSLSAIVEMYLM